MPQTPVPIVTNDMGLPILPSPTELYDQIMGQIEPELVSSSVPLLPTKYQSETPKDAKARRERYKKAFATYSTKLRAYNEALRRQIRSFGVQAARSFEAQSRKGEETDLLVLADDIENSPSPSV